MSEILPISVCGLAVLCALLLGVMLWADSLSQDLDEMRVEAVKRGHATWDVSDEGVTEWKWIPLEP